MNAISSAAAVGITLLAIAATSCGGGSSSKPVSPESATQTPPASDATATIIPTLAAADASATSAAEDATSTAVIDQYITGGDPNATPQIVSTIPAVRPRSGTTPVVDSTEIAPANPDGTERAVFVDMDASAPGIQSSRDVNRGDVFQVGIVLVGIPPFQNNIGGIAALDLLVSYDKTKIVAPTYIGGPPTDRNPRLNLAGLDGDAAAWMCVPGPEGDLDDPGGIGGDGKPETGQAHLSCFNPSNATASGTIVVATISFTAIATGSSELQLSGVEAADTLGTAFAHCADLGPEAVVPCMNGTVNVK